MTPIDARPVPDLHVLEPALTAAVRTTAANIGRFAEWYPDDTTTDGWYAPRVARGPFPEGSNHGWTTSFWPGMLWLAHDVSGEDAFREAGLSQVEKFAARVELGIDLGTHDLGFLYTLSCVAPWRRLGHQRARDAAILAAEHLMTRFLEPAGIIQAWGDLANPEQQGRTIIDSLMNMPLLYWAAEQTGDDRFADAARRHTAQLRDHNIRPDNTTFHTFYWDTETGRPLRGATEQGANDDSCWARGQAWGIYGFALGFRYASDESFLRAAERCADYFLDNLPEDHVSYWDLTLAGGGDRERDSSAAAIAACGLDELAGWLPDGYRKERYAAAAHAILVSLATGYSTADQPGSNALLLHGVYDMPKAIGVDEGTLWGDYFYLEALTRATRPGWALPW